MNKPNFNAMLNKVPEVILSFWIIKILATTVGETVADFLSTTLNLGLDTTSYIMGWLLIIALIIQFRSKKYVPVYYWIAVVLISIVWTLTTDKMVDDLDISLVTTTIIFAIALIVTFVTWYLQEKTLSIHSITTRKREAFYWLAILCTFALGTASGDLLAEGLSLGYLSSVLIFAGSIAIITLAYRYAKLNAILAFWMAYILTRPLWASIGDLLSQAPSDGGRGLGTTLTSSIFLLAILVFVIYSSMDNKISQQKIEKQS